MARDYTVGSSLAARDTSLMPCDCCRRGFDTLTVYRPRDTEQAEAAICDECCQELLRDLLEDSSPGFVDLLFKRIRHR
jgi:hypothetical protein